MTFQVFAREIWTDCETVFNRDSVFWLKSIFPHPCLICYGDDRRESCTFQSSSICFNFLQKSVWSLCPRSSAFTHRISAHIRSHFLILFHSSICFRSTPLSSDASAIHTLNDHLGISLICGDSLFSTLLSDEVADPFVYGQFSRHFAFALSLRSHLTL